MENKAVETARFLTANITGAIAKSDTLRPVVDAALERLEFSAEDRTMALNDVFGARTVQ